ncbi:MAG: DUF2970 domain-containing protein [Thalassospira sp.]|uniref:DUF2970 domain-containing protein n=1 Tax=Thalassospira sp. TaxID=1912094 RepID=UPI000C56DB14|nr:DUF2970 domain-containing protein [Thalassospira sp.]
MWLKRIIASFFGIRKSSDLETDMKNISLGKFIFLFLIINCSFIFFVLLIINLIT